MDTIRTRMAPSPTGWFHVGNARTALFNYLFARKHGGTFILRIEDTDTERSRKEFEEDMLAQLQWLGIQWDEGPYRQSERTHAYQKNLKRLLTEGNAFYCAHTKKELEEEYQTQLQAKTAPRHICSHRDAGREEGIIRLKNDGIGALVFNDAIRGLISFDQNLLGDFSIARSMESPLYNFVVVIDDAEMRITHVIRGEDHIPNTPKQILIQRALGLSEPHYAHLPLLLGTDRSKLSKRHSTVAVRDYRAAGYLPEAMVNFLALLGWNPGDDREFFTLGELTQEFSLEKIQKAGAVFNEDKLRWMNKEYIRRLQPEQLAERLISFTREKTISTDFLQRIAAVEKERLTTLADIKENLPLYGSDPAYKPALLRWKGTQEYREVAMHLMAVRKILCDMKEQSFSDVNTIMNSIMPHAETHGKGTVLWPLRTALSGKKTSPGPFEIIYILGKEASIRRIDMALEMLASLQNSAL